MRRSLVLLPLVVAISGCIIEGEASPEGVREIGDGGALVLSNLRLTVTLDGRTCDEATEVAELTILVTSSSGGAVVDDRSACPVSGTELVIPDLLPGRYAWVIKALAADGAVLYEGAGSIVMGAGDERVSVDLTAGGTGATGVLNFRWTFDGFSCAEAGVDLVRIVLPGLDETVPCAPPDAAEGATIEGMPAGATTWALTGLNAAGGAAFVATGSTVVPAEGELEEIAALVSQGNALEIVWTFAGQGSCPLAGVDRVHLSLRNGAGLVAELDRACTDGLARIPGLPLGSYSIGAVGRDDAGVTLFELTDAAATVDDASARVVVDLPVVP